MRFTIKKEPFLKTLTIAGRAAPVKSAVPALSNIKFDLNEKGLELTGCNGEMTIDSVVPYMIGEEEIIRSASVGKILVSAHYITEASRRREGSEIHFEVGDSSLAKIDDGRTSIKLVCANAEEYPDIDKISPYAAEAMRWANAEGLINGMSNGKTVTLAPNGNATRAQVAAIFMRYVQNVLTKVPK